MNLKITFYPDGRWEGGGVLPRHLKDLGNLAAWLQAFLGEIKDLRKNFLSAIRSDGKILGQEKANLVIEIDDIIGGVLLFRRYLAEEHPDAVESTDGVSFRYSVTLLENSWNGYGKLAHAGKLENMCFSDLHNDFILDRVKELFTVYGRAGADLTITSSERAELCEKTDILFRDLLCIERRLLHSTIAG